MRPPRESDYFRARGFSVYYVANAVFNIVSSPMLYARGIEDILGDMRAERLMNPFQRYSNLHSFIHDIALDVITEEIDSDIGEGRLIRQFFKIFDVAFDDDVLADEESFWTFANESERFYQASRSCPTRSFTSSSSMSCSCKSSTLCVPATSSFPVSGQTSGPRPAP